MQFHRNAFVDFTERIRIFRRNGAAVRKRRKKRRVVHFELCIKWKAINWMFRCKTMQLRMDGDRSGTDNKCFDWHKLLARIVTRTHAQPHAHIHVPGSIRHDLCMCTIATRIQRFLCVPRILFIYWSIVDRHFSLAVYLSIASANLYAASNSRLCELRTISTFLGPWQRHASTSRLFNRIIFIKMRAVHLVEIHQHWKWRLQNGCDLFAVRDLLSVGSKPHFHMYFGSHFNFINIL